MRQTASALVSLLVGALVALGAAPAQAVRTWGCTAVLPGAGALPAGVRLVAVYGGERSEPSPPAEALPLPSWETEPDQTVVNWAQEGPDLTGYTWLAVSSDGTETPLPGTCEIAIDPGVAVEPPPPPTAPVAPSNLRIHTAVATPPPPDVPPPTIISSLAFDAATSGLASATYNHTTSGEDRVLIVAARVSGIEAVTTVTYAGEPMAFVAEQNQQGDGKARTLVFLVVNPALGSHPVSITTDGLLGDSVATSYTGAAQTGQPQAVATGRTGTAGVFSTSITTTSDGAWVVLVASCYYNLASTKTGPVPDAHYTSRLMSDRIRMGDSAGPVSPAGTFIAATSGASFAGNRNHIWLALTPASVSPIKAQQE